MEHNLRIGLTGGIGSGKSFVARLLCQTFQLSLYDSDTRAKQLMTSSPEIRRELCSLLGSEAYLHSGELNRQLLANYLFHNERNAQRINAIVHPAVRRDWLQFAAQAATPALIESAILIQAGLADTVDYIILVSAPESLRIQRASSRDNSDPLSVQARIRAQMSEDQLLPHADYVIINDGRPLMPQLYTIPFLIPNPQ